MSEIQRPAKVITVTLNPSLDRTLTTHFLSPGYHNRTTGTSRLDPAGRGVNVSRALSAQGIPTHAVILLGHDPIGRAYESILGDEQFPRTILRHNGTTRSNLILVDTGHNTVTNISEDGGPVSREDRQAVANALTALINPRDTVVFGGSLSPGMREDAYAVLTSLAQTAGAAVAINAGGGAPLEQAIQAHPLLLYATQTQLEGLFNVPLRAYQDVLSATRRLCERGVKRVLVSMEQAHQAFLVTETGAWRASWPETSGTPSGRAEALIAGYLAGRLDGQSFEGALRHAAATVAHIVTQIGYAFGGRHEIDAHRDEVDVISADAIDQMAQPPSDFRVTQTVEPVSD